MINKREIYRSLVEKRSNLDKFGLYLLFSLLILNPFHYVMTTEYPYYRELAAAIFLLLWFVQFFGRRGSRTKFHIRKELFFIGLFPVLLLLFRTIDPGVSLYGRFDLHEVSTQIDSIDQGLYVVRNACLYLPMLAYISLRGLSEKEIRQIALISVIVAPVSVLAFLSSKDINISSIVTLGGANLDYNSFVPYLTFPVLSSLYLIMCDSSKLIKIMASVVLLLLCIYIILSTSRQSALFSLLCIVVFFKMNKGSSLFKKILTIILLLSVGIFIFQQSIKDQVLNENFTEKYMDSGGTIKTSRLQIATDGLALLEPDEYFTGAGLTSVIVSGPHNDFVRWIQRVGIFVMIVGFLPFMLSAKKIYPYLKESKNNTLMLYIFLSILYTLFHSFFGYPREDAYQAMYCFLGLSLWLGFEQQVCQTQALHKR